MALFMGCDRDGNVHKGIADTPDTVLLVEKANTVQIGTLDLIRPLLRVIRIGRFSSIATAAIPPLRHLLTSTRGQRFRPL